MFDFSGWATKNDIKCRDGRIIRRNAFKDMDGIQVPLVWSHDHKSPENVLGHAVLENRPEGVYAYCTLNEDTDGGKQTKALIKHGDINSLSIYANDLVQKGSDVMRGVIREVSVCLAGANPLAKIDKVLAHDMEGASEGLIITAGDCNPIIFSMEGEKEMLIRHSMEENIEDDYEEYEDESEYELDDLDEEDDEEEEERVDDFEHDAFSDNLSAEDILDTLTEEQLAVVDQIVESAYAAGLNENGGNEEMRHSVFDNQYSVDERPVLAHDALEAIFTDAASCGSLKQAALAHAGDYGIDDIDMLFPDAKATSNEPEFIKRKTEWVAKVMSGTKHLPFTRIKSLFADITEEEARAKGYIKGNRKIEEVFGLLKRQTGPTTVYKKQKLDRDDIIDIKDFNVVAWLRQEMRMMLDEEVARSILIGDGRSPLSPDKIKEDCVRPIWKEDELFAISNAVPYSSTDTPEQKAKKFIKNVIRTRKDYRGSGNITMFCGEDILADMLLIEDKNERIIYDTVDKLKNVLRVKDIVTVPAFDTLTRDVNGKTMYMGAILVDLNDYSVGTDRGGEINTFDDFDIDYNQNKYLMETRYSGCLTKPFSAMIYEFAVDGTIEPNGPEDPTDKLFSEDDVTIADIQGELYANSENFVGEAYKQTEWTAFGSGAAGTGYFIAINAGSGVTVTATNGAVKPVTESGSSATHVIRIDDKHKCKVTLTKGSVSKTYAVTGIKCYPVKAE